MQVVFTRCSQHKYFHVVSECRIRVFRLESKLLIENMMSGIVAFSASPPPPPVAVVESGAWCSGF